MKVLLGVVIGIVAVVLVLCLVAGYFGFLPGFSKIFGSDKPRALGVTYTHADYISATTQDKITRVDLPSNTAPAQSLSFSGSIPANLNLTSAQATAMINDNPWPYWVLQNCQLRFNADGTGEMSGIVRLDKIHDYAIARGYSEGDINTAVDQLQKFAVFQKQMPFYVKGTGSVINSNINFNIDKFEIGRLSIPAKQLNDRKDELIGYARGAMNRVAGLSVKNFSISAGKIHFDGTLPQIIKRAVTLPSATKK